MRAISLKAEHLTDPIGLATEYPLLSWCCSDGNFQTGFEIEFKSGNGDEWGSGKIASGSMQYRCERRLSSRERVFWRVRLWDENDTIGEWSSDAVFELGITDSTQWQAKWIGAKCSEASSDYNDIINKKAKEAWELSGKKGCFEPHLPATYLRKSFKAASLENARLYITSRGIFKAFLNGQRVGEDVLAPGPAVYSEYFPCRSYDISPLLVCGENELVVVLGDGWYRSCSGVNGDRNLYGRTQQLVCQVMLGDEVVCVSDESWSASVSGPIRQNDLQQGEVYDARLESFEFDLGVEAVFCDTSVLHADCSLPITQAESFSGTLMTTPNGETVLDFGQNIAGYIGLSVNARAGQQIMLMCGETLDENGNFTQENFQDRKRHSENGTHQMIEYICKDGHNCYIPSFTIMGFRYARLETDIDISDAEFTAYAVYSKMEQTTFFNCGDDRVNRLFENCIWSQKSNFCGVPTDCPTRERAGWTGDAGVFVETGITLMDSYPVFDKWLKDCRYSQYPDGRVANIAPKINRPGFMTKQLAGSVGWGDACILVPWALYRRSGDISILSRNYLMMQKWYAYLGTRAKKGRLKKYIKYGKSGKYLINSGLDYGEWCEPDVDNIKSMMNGKKSTATAYYAYSGAILAKIARILGHEDDVIRYNKLSKGAAEAYFAAFTRNGRIESERQCEYVRALKFELLPEDCRESAAAQLNELVKNNGYHLNTGFLSTPFLCEMLAEYGCIDTAEKLLLQNTSPAWLYAVEKGGTTIWEHWNGIGEDGTVTASLNHYSYGAVSGWLVRGVCGITQEGQELVLSPTVLPALGHANAVYLSPVGTIECGWRCLEGGATQFDICVPANVTAHFKVGAHAQSLMPGRHRIIL